MLLGGAEGKGRCGGVHKRHILYGNLSRQRLEHGHVRGVSQCPKSSDLHYEMHEAPRCVCSSFLRWFISIDALVTMIDRSITIKYHRSGCPESHPRLSCSSCCSSSSASSRSRFSCCLVLFDTFSIYGKAADRAKRCGKKNIFGA